MSHTHKILDADKHFVINPVTRTITNESGKLVVTQTDHNSERYTFEVPRYVEDHDMGESTRIEIHYNNSIRTKKEVKKDVYPVPAADISSTRDKVYFSWLVSGNATQLVGYLTFSVTFICHDEENEVVYSWSTGIFENIQVLEKHNNTENILTAYPDLYEQLKQEILNNIPSSDGTIDNVVDFGDSGPEIDTEDEEDNVVEF